ncbi:MAG: DUF1553 domain-containing protein [Planctomycetes bacterium]|nr:DUF1553 domain-containing protein [Planctomycetota bacterium]
MIRCRPQHALLAAILALAAVIVAAPGDKAATKSATKPATNPFEGAAAPAPESQIDKLVFARLEKLGIKPANLCSDAVFVRRAFLDVIGTLPTEKEARDFLSDSSPNKRSALVDKLLARDEFTDYWAMKWCDLLRVKAEFPINLWPKAAQAYHHWIWTCIKENKPYDRIVRALLLSSGSSYYVPEANFYRAVPAKDPQTIAKAAALTFMGSRAEKWPKDRLDGMAAFFSQVSYKYTGEWKEEIVFLDPSKVPDEKSKAPVFPDGAAAKVAPGKDPREVFADWLVAPENPWFARNVVNRIWFWLQGRGIIHEADDIRPDNPPQNPELLKYLEKELVSSGYNLKHIYKLILNSRTYQLSPIPQSRDPKALANFACYPMRRLDAEVLIDALCQISGTTEKYSSMVPEPFTFIPEELRSIELGDGNTTSSFLEVFGRPARETGLESERSNLPAANQQLCLLNSSLVQRKIEQGRKLQAITQSKAAPREVLNSVYLTILSRFPTDEEVKIIAAYPQTSGQKGRDATYDIIWSLINSEEFLFRH